MYMRHLVAWTTPVVPEPPDEMAKQTKDLYLVMEDGHLGVIDGKGTVIFTMLLETVPTSGVSIESRWAYVGAGGRMAIQPQFDDAVDRRAGLAPMREALP